VVERRFSVAPHTAVEDVDEARDVGVRAAVKGEVERRAAQP